MYNKLKIIEHQHSGRLRPHEHTSYLPLAFLVLVVGFLLILFSFSTPTEASPGPEGGSVGLSGSVPAKPPKVAAVITSPINGQHFTTTPVNISGTCTDGTLIEIFKNNIFAGSAPCDSNGKFSISVDLLYGKNTLIAKIFDVLNQAGPDSAPVTVYNDMPQPSTSFGAFADFTGQQLILSTDSVYRGKFPKQQLNVPISIIGGTPPFAINVDWGDSNSDIIPRGNNTVFNALHAYKKPGIYKITIKGSDSHLLVAFLQVAAFINGQPSVIAANASTPAKASKILMLWPIFAIAVTLVVSFWMGERREKKILLKAEAAAQNPFAPTTPQPQA
jgi:hypothetical protein